MRLSDIMTTDVRTIAPTDRLDVARRELQERRIHHLVVVEHGEPVGILSSHDLDRPAGSTVADAMTATPVVATSRTTVRQAANLLRGNGIGCLPIVDGGGKLVGIVTTADLLDMLGKGAWKGQATQLRPMWRRGPRKRSPKPARI